MIYTRIVADLIRPNNMVLVHAHQGNTGEGVEIALTVNGVSFDVSQIDEARIYVKKSDGNAVYSVCNLDTTLNLVRADFTYQMLAIYGDSEAEIEIIIGDINIATPIFTLRVGKSNIAEDIVESESEFGVVEAALSAKVEGVINEIVDISPFFGLPSSVKEAILSLAEDAEYISGDQQDHYDELYAALYGEQWAFSVAVITSNDVDALINSIR